jgi:hypothetical protein
VVLYQHVPLSNKSPKVYPQNQACRILSHGQYRYNNIHIKQD